MKIETLAKAAAIAIWIICIGLWAILNIWPFFAGLLLLHTIELFVKAIPIGRKAGIPITAVLCMTLMFGITWWRPIEQRLLK